MSKKWCASTIGIAGILLFAIPAITAASQSQTQPRDPRPAPRQSAASREQGLKAATVANPANVTAWIELAQLQEARGATDEAERTFKAALSATGGARELLVSMSGFFNRLGQFDQTIAALEQAAAKNPTDAAGHQLVAVYYFDKANRDHALSSADKLTYVDAGIAATDRAIAQKADYVEALTYKNLLLRVKANIEADPARRQATTRSTGSSRCAWAGTSRRQPRSTTFVRYIRRKHWMSVSQAW